LKPFGVCYLLLIPTLFYVREGKGIVSTRAAPVAIDIPQHMS